MTPLPSCNNIRKNIKCEFCAKYFHVKCAQISTKDYRLSPNWSCLGCRKDIFPLTDINNDDLEFAITNRQTRLVPTKKTKCSDCSKRLNKNKFILCKTCPRFFHKQCANQRHESPEWQCNKCTLGSLPFSTCNDMDYLANIFDFWIMIQLNS